MRRTYRGLHRRGLTRVETEAREREVGRQRLEAAQHELLAEQRGQRADPVVAALAGVDRNAQPAVLRKPPLGDVHPGEHLDPRDDRVAQMNRRAQVLVQHAVDAQPDAPARFERFDVDVGRVAYARGMQRIGEQPYRGGVVELRGIERARRRGRRRGGGERRPLRVQRRRGRGRLHVSRRWAAC